MDTAMARVFVWLACALGVIHAMSSLYWALGGRWLLETVGQWAVDAVEDEPVLAAAALGGLGLAKLAAAVVPVLVEYGRLPWRPFWRLLSWLGGLGLVVYGMLHIVTGALVLGGVIVAEGGYDRAAIAGHAVLWGPLFALWGAALTLSLWLSRHLSWDGSRAPTGTSPRRPRPARRRSALSEQRDPSSDGARGRARVSRRRTPPRSR